MGGVEAFVTPFRTKRLEAPVAQLRDGSTVVVAAQKQDWLKVRRRVAGSTRVICTM